MRITAFTALALALCSTAAAAAEVGGAYSVAGTNLDGSPYSGAANITVTSNSTCEIVWTTGNTESRGICMLNDDSFAAGYVLQEKIGLIIYKVMPDGTLDGVWTLADTNGAGTEVLTPVR